MALTAVVGIWGALALVLFGADDGTATLIFLFLSIPFAVATLVIWLCDRSWRSWLAKKPTHRDLSALLPRDPPE